MLKMFETGIAGFFIYKLTCKRHTMITSEKRRRNKKANN